MPRLLSQRKAKQLQSKTEEQFYSDTATVLQDTVDSLDAYGQPSVTTSSRVIKCSFTDKPKLENWKGYADIEQIAAEIRFTKPVPAKGNRVTLTGRFDELNYVDKTFEIVGIRDRADFGYVCALMKVQI